jgi:mRNA-degrading endonuclease HigB of HigAB toxin-antitoxin module
MVVKKQKRKSRKLEGFTMVKKKEDEIPEWVTDEIQNAKFKKPEEIKSTGYILEFYYEDNKVDIQLYNAVEDGRHIVTMDVAKDIKMDDLLKGEVYEFVFDQHKAPLSKKVSEFLEKEKEIEMKAIYQFDLKSLELLEVGSSESAEEDLEE